jgi:hypothetical protein
MSIFKKNSDFKLFYTDTDSAFIDKPLPDSLITNELGNFKLEHRLKKYVGLGPKIYALINSKDEYICKVKGYKNPYSIPFTEMKSLLERDKFFFNKIYILIN